MFQSTPSGGKATRTATETTARRRVSIHAFRGEGDVTPMASAKTPTFQSTPSGGKATSTISRSLPGCVFQSTPSGGKATRDAQKAAQTRDVSIHAFRVERGGI